MEVKIGGCEKVFPEVIYLKQITKPLEGIDDADDWKRHKLELTNLLVWIFAKQFQQRLELLQQLKFQYEDTFQIGVVKESEAQRVLQIIITLWIAELILRFLNLEAVSGTQLDVLQLKALALNLIKSGDVESNPGPSNGLTLRNLVNELIQVQTKWCEIGVQFGIEYHRLKAIKQESSGSEVHMFIEVIYRWLQGNTDVPLSWESVVKALKTPSVDEKGLADQLHKKYCQPDDASGQLVPRGQARHSDIQEGELVSSSVSKSVRKTPHGVKVSITYEYEYRDELPPDLKRFCPELKVEGDHHVEALEKDQCVQKIQRKLRRMKNRRQKLKQRIKSSQVYTHRVKNK